MATAHPPAPAADAATAALVERARAGDRAALDRLLVVARPQLVRYARRHCEAEDVEEAVQDALWVLYRRLGGLRRAAAFAGWLFQVARRACLRYARAARARLAAVPLDAAPPGADTDPAAGDPALRVALADAIAALPPAYRAALLLKDVQGLSANELGAALGLSPEGAKSRLHRARALVRAALAEQPAACPPPPATTLTSRPPRP